MTLKPCSVASIFDIDEVARTIRTALSRRAASASELDDLVQETTLALLERAEFAQLRLPDQKRYAATVARRVASLHRRTHHRRTRREAVVAGESPLWAESMHSRIEDLELRVGVLLAFLDLPDGLARVAFSHWIDGLTVIELARVYELPVGTIKSRLRRALKSLRRFMSADQDQSVAERLRTIDCELGGADTWIEAVFRCGRAIN